MAKFLTSDGAIPLRGYTKEVDYAGSIAIQDSEVVKFARSGTAGWIPVGAVAPTGIGLYVAAEAKTASSAAGKLKVFGDPNMEFWIQVKEIALATSLTATGGGTTTFVDSSLVMGQDDVLIGTVVAVVAMASGDKDADTELTVTDYTSSSGTLTFASLGSTGFASGDTIKIVSLGRNAIEALHFGLYYVNGSTADEGCMLQMGGATGANWCQIKELNKTGQFSGFAAGTLAKIKLVAHNDAAVPALRTL